VAVLELVDAEHPPLRLLAGNRAFDIAHAVDAPRLTAWDAGERASRGAGKA